MEPTLKQVKELLAKYGSRWIINPRDLIPVAYQGSPSEGAYLKSYLEARPHLTVDMITREISYYSEYKEGAMVEFEEGKFAHKDKEYDQNRADLLDFLREYIEDSYTIGVLRNKAVHFNYVVGFMNNQVVSYTTNHHPLYDFPEGMVVFNWKEISLVDYILSILP